ncbi:MAG: ABC transporter ATP-binding protein [Acidobacteriota bacterium]
MNTTTLAPAILPASPAPIEIRELSFSYGVKEVLHRVSLVVEAGSVYALLGRNGAGKSSLIRCLLGHQPAASGRARLLGMDSWSERARALARIGVVPEEPDAPPHLDCAALEAFCADLYPSWDSTAVRRRLARFGVPLTTAFGELSKGQKSQALLALALGHSPELLILDDPTLGLDAVARRAVFDELIGELGERGTTVLFASHDMEGIERIADRVGILAAGRLFVDEPLEELRQRFRRINGSATLEPSDLEVLAPLLPQGVRTLAWGREIVVTQFDDREFAPLAARLDLAARAMSLEEIFVVLVGEDAA